MTKRSQRPTCTPCPALPQMPLRPLLQALALCGLVVWPLANGAGGPPPSEAIKLAFSAWQSAAAAPDASSRQTEPSPPAAQPLHSDTLLLATSRWGDAPLGRALQSMAGRSQRPVASDSPSQAEVLLLDVVINGQRQPDVARAEQWPDGALLLAAGTWSDARLAPLPQGRTLSDGSAGYALDAVPGATYRVNRQNLSLEINAPATAFVGSVLGLRGETALQATRSQPGVLLNYDISLQRGVVGSEVTGGATLEAVALTGIGNFVNSALVRHDGVSRTVERLDSFWRYDMPQRLETLVVGDTVGTGGGWSRPARYGGLRWGRDFGMRPGFITFPQVSLSGEAALPSTVEVLVNNARRMSLPVAPGPFELPNVPVITGAGELNLVVRDLLGRETVVQQSYYASPRLLAPGLTDFSIEGGKLRTGYGRDSRYGSAFGAFTWRQGLTTSLTGEGRIELQADRSAAGVELASLLGKWGVGRMVWAASSDKIQGPREQGQLFQIGVERSTPRGGGAVQYEFASRGFAPLGEGQGPTVVAQRSRERLLASIGGALWERISGGASYVSQSRWDGDQVRSLGLSATRPLGTRASLSLSVTKRIDGDRSWRTSLTLNLPLDTGIYTSARIDRAVDGKLSSTASAARNVPAGTGLGWRAEGSTQDSQRARGSLQYNTHQAELALDASSDAKGQVALRSGARGTLGRVAGLPFASRPVGQGSFAVVEVEGMAGVPIKRSHQVVAETDSRGLAFVPGLLPWQKNQIEINPDDLPLDAEIGDTVRLVTPFAGSAALVKFAVRRSRQALVVLQQPDGTPVPVGTQVRLLPSGVEFIAGRRGEVWLTDLGTENHRLQVRWASGGCDLSLVLPASDGTPAKIGPLGCAKE